MTPRLLTTTPRKVLAALVGVYLLLGNVFAYAATSAPVWECPDPSAPHGYRTGSEKRSEDCVPAHSAGERLQAHATLTAFWLPLITAKALDTP